MTPLDYAVLYGYLDKVKYLVEVVGVDVFRKDEVGQLSTARYMNSFANC